MAPIGNGLFALAWTRTDPGTGGTTVMYEILDAFSSATSAIEVTPGGSPGENRNAAVIATTDGFAIAYESRVFGFTGMDIFIRYYDLNGVEVGNDLVTNRSFGNTGVDDGTDDSAPAFARAPDGNIAITWTSNDGTDTNQHMALLSNLDNPVQVGFAQGANAQGKGAVTFFGSGQIAAYLVDSTTGAVRGQHFEGFRDSFGDDSADTFTGDDFRDLINGLGGDDTLDGGNGNDTILGGDGSDTLYGGDGDDLLQGEEGNGAQAPGVHNDYIAGGNGNDTLHGEDGNDILFGGSGIDQMFGGIGNDDFHLVDGSTEADETYDGGDGFDYLVPFGSGASMFDFRAATVTAIEQIYFASGYGGGATMRFNADQFTFQSVFFEPQGTGARIVSIDMEDLATLNLSGLGIQGTPGAGDRFEINGDDAGETITGTSRADVINGGAGNDTLDGKGGADTLAGGADNDRYYIDQAGDIVQEAAGGGADKVYASVSYTLTAGAEVETLLARDAAATTAIYLYGNEFGQRLTGNAGDNILDGKAGADTHAGLGGNDRYYVDHAGDVVQEAVGGGADRVYTTVNHTLTANSEIETFLARDAAATTVMTLTGNTFGQRITGNAGLNVIYGKQGNDTLVGLGGADNFIFDTALGAGNVDTLTDFSHADDTIRLDDAIFTGLMANAYIAANQFHVGAAAADTFDRIIYNNVTGALIFDADGSGAGAAQQFATLAAGLALANNDFYVI